jgi:phytoene/squalene synthetase
MTGQRHGVHGRVRRAFYRSERDKQRAANSPAAKRAGTAITLARLRKLHDDGKCQGRHYCPVCMIAYIRATNT